MDNETKKDKQEQEEEFFKDFLDVSDDEDETDEEQGDGSEEKSGTDDSEEEKRKLAEEEQRRKNKDAEEARKRREAEAKKKDKQETEKKKPGTDEMEKRLGDELYAFKRRYPDIDLEKLDKDSTFRKYLDGKLFGRKNFTELYEEYVEFRKELSGKSEEEIIKSHQRKAESGSPSSTGGGKTNVPDDIYSEEELQKIADKIPFMSDQELAKVESRFDKSLEFYRKKK
jgi:hypothetical protein